MLARTAYKMKPPQAARLVSGHPLARDLVLDMSLREGSGVTAFDASGRRHDGTIQTGSTWTMGKYGPALDFDGISGHIEIADHADFTPALHPFSIAARIYMHDSDNFRIASKHTGANDGEWGFVVSSAHKLSSLLYDQSVAICFLGRRYNTVLTSLENTWLDVATTYDGGILSASIKLYLNGARCDNTNNQNNAENFVAVEDSAQPVRVGMAQASHADGLNGYVRIWRRVLTLSDVQLLHRRPFCLYDKRRRLPAGVA